MRCPICNNEILDKNAITCPSCGFPIGVTQDNPKTNENSSKIRSRGAENVGDGYDFTGRNILPSDSTDKPSAGTTTAASSEYLDSLWPNWKLEKKAIGQGQYGTVYRAMCEENGYKLYSAIKVIQIPANESELDPFRAEGVDTEGIVAYFQNVVNELDEGLRALKELNGNQNIVKVEDYKIVRRTDQFGWAVNVRMELLTPLNVYAGNRKLTEQEVVSIGCDICKAVEVFADRGIVLREIEPKHIFTDGLGVFKLGAININRELERTVATYKGFPYYLAPEVIYGNDYDSRADIYSLGLILYRYLNNNRHPLLDTEKGAVTSADWQKLSQLTAKGEKLPRPSEASETVADVVVKACAFRQEERYPTVKDFLNALNGANEKNAGAKAPKHHGKTVAIVATVLLIVAVVTGGILFKDKLWKAEQQDDQASASPTPVAEQVVVPDVKGATLSEAKRMLSEVGLECDVRDFLYDADVERDHVAATSPVSGTSVDKTETILLYLSKGKEMIRVPSVINMSKTEATELLRDKGFDVEIKTTELFLSDTGDLIPEGIIVSQSPNPNSEKEKGGKITLFASTGRYLVLVNLKECEGPGQGDSPYLAYYKEAYGELPTPECVGYTFKGWMTAPESQDGKIINKRTKVTNKDTHDLYAKWEANRYKVKFNLNCKDATIKATEITVFYDSEYGWKLIEPTRRGWKFAGWFTEAKGGTQIKQDTIVKITENTELYAHWEKE